MGGETEKVESGDSLATPPCTDSFSLTRQAKAMFTPILTSADSRVSRIVRMSLRTMSFACHRMMPIAQAVLSIFRLCSIGKVGNRVVAFVVIVVSRFKAIGHRTEKGFTNNAMNSDGKHSSSRWTPKRYLQVAPSQVLFSYASTWKAPYSPGRRNFVKTFIPNDGTPFFGCVKLIFRHRLEFLSSSRWAGIALNSFASSPILAHDVVDTKKISGVFR